MVPFDRVEFAAGLVRVVALHDENTATHLRATGVLAGRIAAHMKLAADVISAVELAGLLHDIGKVHVTRNVLCKPGELDATEWVEMRLHAEAGAAALAGLPMLAHIAPIVRAHHERMDGQGYPDGLRGDEIPLEARIVAVADAFHALTTDRPYHRAVLPQTALRILTAAAGPQFDRDVVIAALDLLGHPRATRQISA